jgi:hypothetical protein
MLGHLKVLSYKLTKGETADIYYSASLRFYVAVYQSNAEQAYICGNQSLDIVIEETGEWMRRYYDEIELIS